MITQIKVESPEGNGSMRLHRALSENTGVQIFRVDESGGTDQSLPEDWLVDPLPGDVLQEESGLFVLAAIQILESGETKDCFIDLTMPERIADYAYFVDAGILQRRYIHDCDGEVICAVPVDGFGQYDLFYSHKKPDVGISVLRRGLELANRKAFIAEDLGYILRDEERLDESIVAFEISAQEEPSSYFIYVELADLLDRAGEHERAAEYRAKIPQSDQRAHKRPWWKFWE